MLAPQWGFQDPSDRRMRLLRMRNELLKMGTSAADLDDELSLGSIRWPLFAVVAALSHHPSLWVYQQTGSIVPLHPTFQFVNHVATCRCCFALASSSIEVQQRVSCPALRAQPCWQLTGKWVPGQRLSIRPCRCWDGEVVDNTGRLQSDGQQHASA